MIFKEQVEDSDWCLGPVAQGIISCSPERCFQGWMVAQYRGVPMVLVQYRGVPMVPVQYTGIWEASGRHLGGICCWLLAAGCRLLAAS